MPNWFNRIFSNISLVIKGKITRHVYKPHEIFIRDIFRVLQQFFLDVTKFEGITFLSAYQKLQKQIHSIWVFIFQLLQIWINAFFIYLLQRYLTLAFQSFYIFTAHHFTHNFSCEVQIFMRCSQQVLFIYIFLGELLNKRRYIKS